MAAIVILLVAIALLIRGAGDQFFRPPYDAAQPTPSKFAEISRWIPKDAELSVAIDVQKALQDPALRERLAAIAAGRQGVAAELVAALLEKQSAVGMLAIVGTAGGEGPGEGRPRIAVIAQGGFDEASFVPEVRSILASGKAGLSSEPVGGRTLYAESDARDPFGFIVLDDRHIAVGDRNSLVALFQDVPAKRAPVTVPADAVLFGQMGLGPRVRGLLPPGLSSISGIEFASTDGKRIVARLAAGDALQAGGARMFLEGIRSLLLLQGEDNPALAKLLRAIAVDEAQGQIVIACDVAPLLELWSPASAQPPAAAEPPVNPETPRS